MEYSPETVRLQKTVEDANKQYDLHLRKIAKSRRFGKNNSKNDLLKQSSTAFDEMLMAEYSLKVSETYDVLHPLLNATHRNKNEITENKFNELISGTIRSLIEARERERVQIFKYFLRARMLQIRNIIRDSIDLIKEELVKRGKKKNTVLREQRLSTILVEAQGNLKTVKNAISKLEKLKAINVWDYNLVQAMSFTGQAEEVLLILVGQLASVKIKAIASDTATDSKYKDDRLLLEKAATVARHMWENGSTLLHHQMKKYLAEEYVDENGKYPFVALELEKSILRTVKQVAIDMNRPDLISGQKKLSKIG